MPHLGGYDHRREECPSQEDTFMEDRQQDHLVHQAEVHQAEVHQAEVHQAEAHQEEALQCPCPPLQQLEADGTTSW
jgi:hypothetical protein